MVSLYGVENNFLREQSSQAVWACGGLTGALVVIDAREVICGVAMIPHVFGGRGTLDVSLEGVKLHLAYDKMGSDMAGLGEADDEEIE